jgi:hypothetical protein
LPLLWQAKSLKDFTRLELVRPEQAQDYGTGTFRAEVKFGDVVPGMTEQRSLWDISQLAFREGDESAFGVSLMLDGSWIGWFPKNDELGNWPGDPLTGKGGIHGGSFLEFHHAPNDGNWNNLKPGSAPFYLGATGTHWRAYLLDANPNGGNFGGLRPDATWLRPMSRWQWTDFVIHALWSTDPAKGYIEIFVDGAPWVPRFKAATLYPSTFVYPQIGIYRRDFIGDPNLRWQAPARTGVTYPAGFFPAAGARVFPIDGGYPQSVSFRNARIGNALEDVMATPPTPAPTPATPGPANFDPSQPSVNPNAGAKELMATRDALVTLIGTLQTRVNAINGLLSQGGYKP